MAPRNDGGDEKSKASAGKAARKGADGGGSRAPRKKATTRKTTGKKTAKKKTAKKKAVRKQAAKKRATGKGAAGKRPAKGTRGSGKGPVVSPKERYEMIAKMAYFRAEKRGFEPGWEQEDWLESERLIDEMLGKMAESE